MPGHRFTMHLRPLHWGENTIPLLIYNIYKSEWQERKLNQIQINFKTLATLYMLYKLKVSGFSWYNIRHFWYIFVLFIKWTIGLKWEPCLSQVHLIQVSFIYWYRKIILEVHVELHVYPLHIKVNKIDLYKYYPWMPKPA